MIPEYWTLAAVFKNIGTKLDWVDVDPYSGEMMRTSTAESCHRIEPGHLARAAAAHLEP